jgi:hypothetical protein
MAPKFYIRYWEAQVLQSFLEKDRVGEAYLFNSIHYTSVPETGILVHLTKQCLIRNYSIQSIISKHGLCRLCLTVMTFILLEKISS